MQSTVPQKVTQGTSDFALARKVLDYMIKHHVPPTPENYTIWHMHLSGKNSELSHEMQRLMMQFPHFSTDVNNYLVSKYMPSSGGKKVQETVQVAQDILNDVMMIIGQFNGEAASQSQKMASKAEDLQQEDGVEALKMMAQDVIQSALSLHKTGADMQMKLQESHEEIDVLRTDLEQAASEVERDFLTGVLNRKGFDRMLGEHMKVAEENTQTLSLLAVDIDHFKAFNDNYGHQIGDEVLKIVAKAMTDSVKGMDVVARYGGEEFMVILPQTPLNGGMAVGKAINQLIASKELKKRNSNDNYGRITVSVGVSTLRQGDSLPSFIKRADDALYAAKHAGRNRVVQERVGL